MPEGGGCRPQRTCLGCRRALDQAHLVRYVCSPDGKVLVDYRNRLPGRGAYTCLDAACIGQAVARRQFDRAFRRPCRRMEADELCAELLSRLEERLASLLGMARKSSQVVSGSNAVLDALDHPERLAAVICAADVSAGIFDKVSRKAAGRDVPCLQFATKAGLGQLLGRDERSVTALKRGRLAEAFLAEWQKYKAISGEI